jgi:hypothetical protein
VIPIFHHYSVEATQKDANAVEKSPLYEIPTCHHWLTSKSLKDYTQRIRINSLMQLSKVVFVIINLDLHKMSENNYFDNFLIIALSLGSTSSKNSLTIERG